MSSAPSPTDPTERRSTAPSSLRLDNRQNATPDEIDAAFRDLRVRVPPFEGLPSEAQQLLRLWVNNVVLPIAWYNEKLVSLERDRLRKNRAMKVITWIGVAAMALFHVAGLVYEPARGLGLTAFQVSLLVTVALTAIEAATDASSLEGRYALFYKARAELRTILYEFADRWGTMAEKPAELPAGASPDPLSAELREALTASIARGREVLRREQEQFFETLRFPSHLTALLFSRALPAARERLASNPLVGQAAESLSLWREAITREREARQALESQQGAPEVTPARLDELRVALRAATAARERAERAVDVLAHFGAR